VSDHSPVVLVGDWSPLEDRLAERLPAPVRTVQSRADASSLLAGADVAGVLLRYEPDAEAAAKDPDAEATGADPDAEAANDDTDASIPDHVPTETVAVDADSVPTDALDAGVTRHVDPDDDADVALLANRVREWLDAPVRGQLADDHRAEITQLHQVATEMKATRTVDQVYDLTVDAAESILDLDLSIVDEVEDGILVPRAVSSDLTVDGYETVPVEDGGLAGECYESGDSMVIEDLRENDAADPEQDKYRSAITAPVGDCGVFQAVSTEVGSFDHEDLELTELLLSHAAESIDRIESERELAERERFLSTLISNVPGMVYRCTNDPGWPIAFVSDGAADLSGYTAEELTSGEVVWGEDVIHPDDADEMWETVQEAMAADEPFEVTYRIQTADGETRWMWEQGRAVDTEDGAEVLEGFIVDVTERKEREAELRKQKDRLDRFARVVSHDLRNPLTVAQGHLDIAREEHDSPSLDAIEEAHDRMVSIIEGVLTLARADEHVSNTAPVDLESAAQDAWSTVDTKEMTLDVADDLEVVYAERSLLRQLLENCFRNACEHAGADANVTVGGVREGGQQVGFYVEDDGPNVPEELRDRVFEFGETSTDDGTGTGLAIVKQIVDAHQWDAEIVDGDAGGARFVFRTAGGVRSAAGGGREAAGDE
jgi:PAS domain S-box-containing protein